jgi:hypothetical protein
MRNEAPVAINQCDPISNAHQHAHAVCMREVNIECYTGWTFGGKTLFVANVVNLHTSSTVMEQGTRLIW